MPRPRENKSLSMVEYDIAGNAIRAYYDNSNKLIFVLDETINADKPNVLLIIDSFDGRKWDEVLVNDFGVDLETVRPKRDNKYQKLDIEYGGLDVYSELIDASESGDDLSDAVANLTRFRTMSVRRAARERLATAEDTIEKSRETIERTNNAISDLRSRIKDLRARIAESRRNIGREPTKASAAKILKAEAQLDAANEKLARAKKRLTSAQHRLSNAEDDAEIARGILARDVPKVAPTKSVSASRKPQPRAVEPVETIDDVDYDIEDSEDIATEPKADEMAEEEIKPLFDKDPENLDDEIAFKPIDFGTAEEVQEEQPIAPAPLSFTPPTQQYSEYSAPADETAASVLDGLTSVQSPELYEEQVDEVSELPSETITEPTEPAVSEPSEPVPEEPVPFAQITPVAPVVRPVSPITGGVTPVEQKPQKSTLVYYLMLILLILLSIGTLWLYQKSASENIPDLAKPVVAETVAKPSEGKPIVADETNKKSDENPFVAVPDIAKEKVVEKKVAVVIPEPVAEHVAVVEPVSVEPEPVAVVAETVTVEAEPIAVEPEPIVVASETPFVDLEPVITKIATYEPEPVKIPTEEEIIARKPGYNVSQNDKMFVASDSYDTETVLVDTIEEEPVESPCEGGVAPDSLGCCPGENYTYTDDGFMCCNAVECFPPAE